MFFAHWSEPPRSSALLHDMSHCPEGMVRRDVCFGQLLRISACKFRHEIKKDSVDSVNLLKDFPEIVKFVIQTLSLKWPYINENVGTLNAPPLASPDFRRN